MGTRMMKIGDAIDARRMTSARPDRKGEKVVIGRRAWERGEITGFFVGAIGVAFADGSREMFRTGNGDLRVPKEEAT